MKDPVDQIRDIINEGGPDQLSRIAKVLGYGEQSLFDYARLQECGVALGRLSNGMGSPAVKADEHGLAGGVVSLALARMTKAAVAIADLEAEVALDDKIIQQLEQLLAAIPECPAHGRCIPHAIEWIEKAKAKS